MAATGLVAGPLDVTRDIPTVIRDWNYSRGDEAYPRSRILDGVTVALRESPEGLPVAFCFSHAYNTLAGLFVSEKYR